MNIRSRVLAGFIVALMVGRVTVAQEFDSALKQIPADITLAVVVPDFTKLDAAINSIAKRMDPNTASAGMLDDVRGEIPFGKSIDFSKPFAFAQMNPRDDKSFMVWVTVKDFAEQAKAMEGAKEEGGVWSMKIGDDEEPKTFFASAKGDNVIGASSEALLKQAMSTEKSLADVLAPRADLFRDRHVLIHFNMEPLRKETLASLTAMAPMVQGMAMMLGTQAGGDPTAMTNYLNTLLDSVTHLITQLSTMDCTIGIGDEEIAATLTTSFKPGPIQSYLGDQEPATMDFFSTVDDQPFFAAMAYHVPGETSPFFSYLFNKMLKSSKPSEAAAGESGASKEESAEKKPDAMNESISTMLELYSAIEGINVIAAHGPNGLKEVGDIAGRDLPNIMTATRKLMDNATELAKQFGMGGMRYEPREKQKVGDVEVLQYDMKLDATNPAMAQAATIYGGNSRLGFGVRGNRVRFALADGSEWDKVFQGTTPPSPLSDVSRIKKALASLPAKRNAVVLIDLPEIMGIYMRMMGAPAPSGTGAVAPIAISVSLVGDPARIDVRVPIEAIERAVKSMTPEQPM